MTARQDLFVAWTAMGMTVKEIAYLFRISGKGAEDIRKKVREHLGYSDAARLTHYAISHKLIALNQTV